jgi:hypothetical protein
MTAIGNLQPIVSGHTTSLATLQTQITTNTADLSTKTTQISIINSIQGGHTTSIGNNYNEIFRLNGISLNHTALLTGLRTDVDSGSGSQADITNLQNDVSTINTTLTAHDGRIFTNTTDVFQLQTNGHEGRLDSVEATVSGLTTSISDIRTLLDDSVTTLIQHSTSIQQNGTTLGIFQQDFIDLRADVDANTLKGSQLLTAIQYQSDSIFAIDTAIQVLNGQVGSLETTQVTHDDLIREFDQNFNDPATGVIFKIDSLTTIYNTHIDGVFLTIRQNVDDNNLILGTLSTHTTSLLTAMTQIYTRVKDLETHHP